MPTDLPKAGTPPREALDYFRAKKFRVGFNHLDVWREEHAAAFTVAKAMKQDVLDAIREEIDRALAEGRTLQQFQKDLEPRLQEMGWWGRKEMTDPKTGEKVSAQLGSPRRLKVIFDANLRSARAAGQWQRAERTKAALPYLLYQLGPSRVHRKDHVQYAGTLLPVDHPWWDSHMPPNGWGCKCRVRQVSRAEYDQLKRDGVPAPRGDAVDDSPRSTPIRDEAGNLTGHHRIARVPVQTEPPQERIVTVRNKRTGRTARVPEGVTPEWSTNPGKHRVQTLRKMLGG